MFTLFTSRKERLGEDMNLNQTLSNPSSYVVQVYIYQSCHNSPPPKPIIFNLVLLKKKTKKQKKEKFEKNPGQ